MALTEHNITSTGATTYPFTFPYLKPTDVKVSVNGIAKTYLTHWEFDTATTIKFNTSHVPPANDLIRIYRETDDSKLEAQFFAGSAIKSSDLNDNFTQNLYVTQESNNKIDAAWTTGDETIISTETWDSLDTRVATTKAIDGRVDAKIDTALTTDVVGGQSITITDNSPGSGQITASVTAGSIRGTELAGDAVDGTKIADDSINSEHYVDGSIDTQHIADAQVTHDKLANDCIDGDNIQNDVINSEHYAPGSIDTEHIADSQVTTVKIADLNVTTAKIAADAITGAKIADDQIDSEHIVADSIDSEHYAPNSVDTNALGADAVTGAQVADNAIDSEHYVDGSVDHVHLSNDCIDGDNIQDNAVNSEHYVDESIDTAHIGNLQVTTAKIAADAIDGTKIADNAIGSEHIAANAVGDSEISTGALDGRYYTKTTSDARYFNISTGDTIKDGDTFPDNDTTIATTAAINDRIIDLVDDVGGFVPIANETSFPFTNPDVNNGAGTLVSIKALASNLTSNGSGVATISNATVPGGSTVTINGLENSTTYSAGYGMIVETTTTTSTYTFHRLVPKATEVTTVAGKATEIGRLGTAAAVEDLGILGTADVVADLAILGTNDVVSDLNTLGTSDVVSDMNTLAVTSVVNNMDTCATNVSNINTVGGSISNVNTVASNMSTVNDFAARYRVASSDPSSNNDEGDLVFNTTSNELRVYNGSTWQGGVTATGNLASLGANTFTGAQTFISSQTFDGRDVSADGSKLDGIEAGATADQTNAEIRAAVEAASDSNVFTDADHSKLNAIEAGATADQTNAEIRAAVEAASDSHVFTDADHTKLNSVESGATADQTAVDIRGLGFFDTSNDGSGSGLDADTVDGIHGASFVRSDADDSMSGVLNLTSSTNDKLILSGSSSPKIVLREGTTNKVQIQWSSDGYIYFWNDESNRGFQLGSTPKWYDGTAYQTLWHQNNDGSGSGLDADLLDGVHGSSFLRSDAADSTNSNLTIKGFTHSNTNDSNYEISTAQSADGSGLVMKRGDGTFQWQIYGQSGYYGFLDGTWASWDIRKQIGGQLEVDVGGTRYEVYHKGNAGNVLQKDTQSYYRASSWIEFYNTISGLYWNSGSANGWHLYPTDTTYMRVRSGNVNSVGLDMYTSNATRGYFYANSSNQIGVLTSGGSWILRCDSGKDTAFFGAVYPYANNSYNLGTSSYKWAQVHATTFHGDGSNLTGISSAPEYAMTASGSVTQGKPLIVNSSGTVEEIVETQSINSSLPTESPSNKTMNAQGNNHGWRHCWEPVSQRLIGCGYSQIWNQNRLWARCMKRTKDNLHDHGLNSSEEFYAKTDNPYPAGYGGAHMVKGASKPAHNESGTVVIAYVHQPGGSGSTRELKVVAGTLAATEKGGEFTWGTPATHSVECRNDSLAPEICYIGNNKFIVVYSSESYGTNYYYKPRAAIVTLSGEGNRTCTWGSASGFFDNDGIGSQAAIAYDASADKACIVYINHDTDLKCITASVSGTTISFSSNQTISTSQWDSQFKCDVTYDANIGKCVCAYLTHHSYRYAKVRVIDIASNNTFSLGTDTSVAGTNSANSASNIQIEYDPWSKRNILVYQCHRPDSTAHIISLNTSNNNISVSSAYQLENDGTRANYPSSMTPVPTFCEMSIMQGNNTRVSMVQMGTATSNISSSNYIGFAKNSASNGGSVTVQLTGSVQENQSGLSPATKYYVQGDGGLGPGPALYYLNETVAGRAISSTKLIIKDS